MSKPPPPSGASRWWRPAAIAVVVLLLLAAGGYFLLSRNAAVQQDIPTYTVEKSDLVISITESGAVSSRDLTKVKSEVRGSTRIIWLIEEGKHVKAGDLLLELDASNFQDQLIDQQIKVQNAQANHTRSVETLEVTKNQAEAAVAQAELDYQFAQEDLVKYKEGEYPKELKEAETKITLAQEEMKQAEERLQGSQELYDQKFISESEYETDRLAKRRKELDFELRTAELDLLKTFTHKRELAKLQSDMEQNQMALERAKRKARADVVQAEADLLAKESELKRQQDKLNDLQQQIENCRVVAPVDGMVVYATTGGNRYRNAEPLQEGSEVRERQELVHLPQSQSMMVQLQIHESSLKKIKVGQPARLTFDALPGRKFTGRVGKIALLPNQTQWWNPDVTVYDAEVYIDGDADGLRTGMKAEVEILVDQYPGAIAVPVQAVQLVGDKSTVWVKHGDRFEPTPVKVGLDNNRMAHILEGLSPGEKVSLTPPLTASQVQDSAMAGDPAGDAVLENNANRYAHAGDWDTATVEQARKVNAGANETSQKQLSAEDRKIVELLTQARDAGMLDKMEMPDDVRSKVDALLAEVDANTVTRIDPDIKKLIRAAMRKMRNASGNGEPREPRERRNRSNGDGDKPGN